MIRVESIVDLTIIERGADQVMPTHKKGALRLHSVSFSAGQKSFRGWRILMALGKTGVWVALLLGLSAVILGQPRTTSDLGNLRDNMSHEALRFSLQKRPLLPFVQTVMRPVGGVKVPPRIKNVDPDYPKTALESQARGVVMLAAVVDESGSVSNVILMRSSPVFAESAIIAVRQWQFEPTLADGKPIIVTIVITLYFDLIEEPMDGFGGVFLSPEEEEELSKLPPIRLGFGAPRPKMLKHGSMSYPEKARRAGIQGTVLLELETDLQGRVKNIIVVKSIPELDDAAIQPARQLIYESFLYDGKPRSFIIMHTSTFNMVGPRR